MGLKNFTEIEKLKKDLDLRLSELTKVNKLCNNKNIGEKIDDTIEIVEKNSELWNNKALETQEEFNDVLVDVSKMKKNKNKSFYNILEPKVKDVESLIKQYKSMIDKLSINKSDKLKLQLQEELTIQKNLYNNRLKKPLIELKALENSMRQLTIDRIELEKDITSARNDYRNSIMEAKKDYSERCNSLVDISESIDGDKAFNKKQTSLVLDIVGDIDDARKEIYESLNSATRSLEYLKSQLSELNNKWEEHVKRKRVLTQNIDIFCGNITDVLNDDLKSKIESAEKKVQEKKVQKIKSFVD